MKRPFVFFAVGADFAFISACAVGSTVPEGIPAGDEAADQPRIATELSVELAATESPTSIEEVMALHRRPSTPKDPERQATKGGQLATTNAVDIVVKSCPANPLSSAWKPQSTSRPTRAQLANGRERLCQMDQFRPEVSSLPGHHTK